MQAVMLFASSPGDTDFDFTTLLHTYIRVEDIYQTSLQGLERCTYQDKVNGGEHVEDRASITINENYDRLEYF